MPFLGSLLLFNQYVVDVLTLSPDLVKRWTGVAVDASTQARDLTLRRLYFVYFGLSFLGIGSGLFALLCPLEVKNNGSAREYLDAEGGAITKVRMALIVPHIAGRYLYWFAEDRFGRASELTKSLAEPTEFASLFSETIAELYSSMPPDEDFAEPPINEEIVTAKVTTELGEEPPLYEHPYTNFRGYPDPDKIADALWAQRNVDRGFWYTIQTLAGGEAHRRDVLTLFYIALDHAKPWSRAAVTFFYLLGFGFLLWPTGLTFVQLSALFLTR